MQPEVRPGEEFAGHRIDRVIGRGGISVVYLAEHLRLGRKVALKVLFPHLADDPGFRDRFIKESRHAAALDHPNIVSVYDAGEVDGLLYLSMRYIEGGDLDRVLRDAGTLDAWRTITIASQVASALDAAHVEGLVHRDVKPGNILLSSPGTSLERAYLADFGITKRMDTREALTRTGQFVGTVDYVAPEQILGQPVDGRTDVYSLGCVLFRCVSGAPPFPRPTDVATIYAHLHDEPAPMVETSVPGLDGVIVRALAKSKDDRYPTCVALVEAARSHLEASDRTQVFERPPTEELPRPVRGAGVVRRRQAVAAAVVVALVLGVIATIAFTRPDGGVPDGSVLGPSGTTTGTSGSTETAAPEPASDPYWFPYPWDELVPDGSPSGQVAISAAAMTDQGTVVAGGHRDDPDEDASLWRRESAEEWVPVDLPGGTGPGNQRIWDVAALGEQIVAVGYDGGVLEGGRAAAWISSDSGQDWDRAAVQGGRSMTAVIVDPAGGFLAFGRDEVEGVDRPLIWASDDGARWRSEPERVTANWGEGFAQAAVALDGEMIAVGSAIGSDGTHDDAAVWESGPDGWTRINPSIFQGASSGILLDVATHGGRAVAVGYTDDGKALAWVRHPGGRWMRAQVPDEPGVATVLLSVIEFGRGFMAAGRVRVDGEDPEDGEQDAAVWWSNDGTTFVRQPPNALSAVLLGGRRAQEIRALLARTPTEVLAFGEEALYPDSKRSHAQLWVGDPSG